MPFTGGDNPRLFDTLARVPDFNIQVSHSQSQNDARSESVVVVNPLNSNNLVGASKEFTNIQTYEFTLAAYYSFDGGLSWNQSPALELMRGSKNLSDPAMAWDNEGNAYLFGLPLGPAPDLGLQGLVVYKSTNGGRTWGKPTLIDQTLSSNPGVGDDKPWATGDYNPSSPHYGNVYVAWDNIRPEAEGTLLVFARSTDHGAHWRGLGNQPITGLAGVRDSFSPELTVGPDGTLYIVWIADSQIKFVRSVDGGETFSPPAVAVSGLAPLFGGSSGSFPEFPPGNFRVETFPTVCAGSVGRVVVAWPDSREGSARIYYRRSTNGGATWEGPLSGQPLLTGPLADTIGLEMNHFHPQLEGMRDGTIACAYYEFGPKRFLAAGQELLKVYLIDVKLVMSIDNGQSFPLSLTVTDAPWDPSIDAPLSHGDENTTFIGDYFGLGVSDQGFYPFWTDTRTGRQDIFVSRVALVAQGEVPRRLDQAVVQILFGVTADGGGKALTVSGGIVIIPPREPARDMLYALAIHELASTLRDRHEGAKLQASAMHAVSAIALKQAGRLDHAHAPVQSYRLEARALNRQTDTRRLSEIEEPV